MPGEAKFVGFDSMLEGDSKERGERSREKGKGLLSRMLAVRGKSL